MTRRFDLTDAQWAVLEPLLPVAKRPGRPAKWAKRQLIGGIRWRVRIGAPWPVYSLFRRRQRTGVWQRTLTRLQAMAGTAGVISWQVGVDSTICRAHQHAAGARRHGKIRSRPNRPITYWAAPAEACRPNRTWPVSRAEDCCRWW
ncbi:transposase [Streptosporangium sp. NPDC020145]|uniref:transposase n=1 Tax=Streptosporangium sp. NPDC020145 TaxID=3154694 RepID=UPI0034423B8A